MPNANLIFMYLKCCKNIKGEKYICQMHQKKIFILYPKFKYRKKNKTNWKQACNLEFINNKTLDFKGI